MVPWRECTQTNAHAFHAISHQVLFRVSPSRPRRHVPRRLGHGLEVHGLGGECELEAQLLYAFHEVEVELLAGLHELGPVGGVGEAVDEDVEAVGPEVVEVDQEEVVSDGGVGFDEAADHLDCGLDFFGGRVVGESDRGLDPPLLHPRPVVNGLGGERRVGEGDQAVGEGADAGGPHAHLLDRAFHLPHLDPVADLEGPVEKDHHRAEKVGERVLAGQGHGRAADAEARHQARHRVAKVLQHQHAADQRQEHLGGAADNGDELVVQPGLGQLGPLDPHQARLVHQPDDEPHHQQRGGGLDHGDHEKADVDRVLRERQRQGGAVKAADDEGPAQRPGEGVDDYLVEPEPGLLRHLAHPLHHGDGHPPEKEPPQHRQEGQRKLREFYAHQLD